MMAAPELETIERLERWACAACHAPGGRTLEPIDVRPVPDCPLHFDYMVSSACCPLCGAENYLTELYVVPDDIGGGRYFMNDNCWEGDGPRYFSARVNSVHWRIAHYINVREVSFEALPGERKPLVRSSAWLDVHYLPTLAAPEFEEGMTRIAELARRIQPAILAMRW